MSEQPLYAYWDEQASSAAAVAAARGQQDNSQQQQVQAHYFQPQQQQQQTATTSAQQQSSQMPFGNAHANSAGQGDPYHAFMMHLPSLRTDFSGSASEQVSSSSNNVPIGAGAAGRGQNQLAVLQLQHNLMLMLQQQQEQSVNDAGDGNVDNTGCQSSSIPQPQQQLQHQSTNPSKVSTSKQQDGNNKVNEDDQYQGSERNSLAGVDLDSINFMAQYHHLFATPLEDTVASAAGGDVANRECITSGNNNQHPSDTTSPSSSRLFALGARVQPLSSNKPEQIISTGDSKAPEISASSLGMSESSSDFMMKLFLDENSKLSSLGNPFDKSVGINCQQQQQRQQQQQPQPIPVSSAQGITTGGRATDALHQLHQQPQEQPDFLQPQQNQLQRLDSAGFPSQQQQHLHQQIAQRQQQLHHLQQQQQQQMNQPQAVDHGTLEYESLQTTSQEDDNFGLPCTMLPPSVLASMFSVEKYQPKPKSIPVKAGRSHVKERKRRYNVEPSRDPDETTDMKPQVLLGEILERRGYDKEYRFKADDSGYDAVPSPLQLASFGTHLVKAVQTSDIALLSKLMECGLSPNPCNQFRDSVFFDLVIKRSNLPIFECLLQHGCDLQVVDGFGRTPLHHCCWASAFCRPIAEAIMERDPVQVFLEDKHGQTPLEYVRTDLYGEWNDFLEEVADKYWPLGGLPPRISSPKERRPDGHLVDPPNALSVSLAAMVSSGAVDPDQIANMDENARRSFGI